MEQEKGRELGPDINPETGNFQTPDTPTPENQPEKQEVEPSVLTKTVPATQQGHNYYTRGSLVRLGGREYGIVTKTRLVPDPGYPTVKRNTLLEMTVQSESGRVVEVTPYSEDNQPRIVYAGHRFRKPTESIDDPVPDKFRANYELTWNDQTYRLGDLVLVDKHNPQIAQAVRIAVIYPGAEPKVGVIARVKKLGGKEKRSGPGYFERIFVVSPDNIIHVEYNEDGSIKGKRRPITINR